MSGIDTISTTPDPEHLMEKWQKNKETSHTEACWAYPASNLYGTHMGSATGFHMGPIWAGLCK